MGYAYNELHYVPVLCRARALFPTIAKHPERKQSPRRSLILLTCSCSLLLIACSAQRTPNLYNRSKISSQNFSVQVVHFHTLRSEAVFVHDSVTLVYALVAPFPTVTDGYLFRRIETCVGGRNCSCALQRTPVIDDMKPRAPRFTDLWGEPATSARAYIAGGSIAGDSLVAVLPSWGIVPFDALEPKWKVLTIDGQSPIRKNFDLASYPLAVNLILQSQTETQPSASAFHRPTTIHPNSQRSS